MSVFFDQLLSFILKKEYLKVSVGKIYNLRKKDKIYRIYGIKRYKSNSKGFFISKIYHLSIFNFKYLSFFTIILWIVKFCI